jgi:site-specific DNA-methyltransferase (adenine-specific)
MSREVGRFDDAADPRGLAGPIDLRLGAWEQALADVGQVDAVICDPPFSARTHSGHRTGVQGAEPKRMRVDKRTGSTYACGDVKRRDISYAAWDEGDVGSFVEGWSGRVVGWWAVLTDHALVPSWEAALGDAGLYVFAPLPFVEIGRSVRLTGDGPSSWVTWLVVARPKTREFSTWGTLPGAYIAGAGMRSRHIGGKPLALMRSIVRDYSRPGDLIVDPCAGGATTLIAAAIEGRRAVGAECDPETYAKAQARIALGYTPVMRFDAEPTGEQRGLNL